MKYIPNPIDISSVNLNTEVLELIEILSKNTHEVWAKARLENGWTFGPHRDDDKKETPCLVSYEDLPESEKEYDRVIVINLIKAIKKLGFNITKKEKDWR